jgi:HSP20 family protein
MSSLDEFFLKPFDNVLDNSNIGDGNDSIMAGTTNALVETGNSFSMDIDLPGDITPEDLDISIADGMFCLRAQKKETQRKDTDTLHEMASASSMIKRKFKIPDNVNVDNIKTNLRNGVLSINMPKKNLDKSAGGKDSRQIKKHAAEF